MKVISTLLMTSLFASTVYAGSGTTNIYGGFADGNSDLSQWLPSAVEKMIGVATVYADSGPTNIYGGFAKGKSDLSQWLPSTGEAVTGVQPGIGDAPYRLGSNRHDALSKSDSVKRASRVDIYGGFAGSDLPSSF
jgi:hypothetical protein